MKETKLMILGGFLGAGKTTALYALGRALQKQGQTVAIVTNDQTQNLVDSALLQNGGFPVLEVTSGCFCCHFSDFAQRLSQLMETEQPDVILAEPVGSCTDLISTIIKPISAGKAPVPLKLSPLAVLVDPLQLNALTSTPDHPFHPEDVPYLFFKQLEEADLIVLSKADASSKEILDAAQKRLSDLFPQTKCLTISAKTGEGIPALLDALDGTPDLSRPQMSLDYDTYAAAEAALSWLNLSCSITSETGFSCDSFLQTLAQRIKDALKDADAEIAHLKLCIQGENGIFSKVSCVGLQHPVTLDDACNTGLREGTLLLNARAACAPERLLDLVLFYMKQEVEDRYAEFTDLTVDCFSPAYPQPVFRM